jgi:hypothetical protein
MCSYGSRKSWAETACRTAALAEWVEAEVLSTPRTTVRVVPTAAVTLTSSSVTYPSSMTRVYGYETGKPLTESTAIDVSLLLIPAVSAVTTAVFE